MPDPFSFDDFLAQQRADYHAALPGRLAQLQAAWADALATDGSQETLHTLERVAHAIAGSAATFGFAPVGDAARTLEEVLDPEDGERPRWPADQARLAGLVDQLAALLQAAIAAPP